MKLAKKRRTRPLSRPRHMWIAGFRVLGTIVLALACGVATAAGSTARRLPPPARVDCGDAGVSGVGFTVFVCGSGAGGTKYAHWPELLVVRSDGSYTGYRDAFGQDDLVRKLAGGRLIASHNNEVVEVTAFALKPLIRTRQLRVAGGSRLGSIDRLTVDSSGDIFLLANYYARNRHGCDYVRWELTAAGRLKLLWRSKAGLTCG